MIEIQILYAQSGEGSSVRKIVLSNTKRGKLLVAEEAKNLSENFMSSGLMHWFPTYQKLDRIMLMLAMHR